MSEFSQHAQQDRTSTHPPSRAMKIVHITNYLVPDYGYEEMQLARAQSRMGHDVAIVTSNFLHPRGSAYGVLKTRFPQRQVEPTDEDQSGVRVIRLASWELPGSRVWMRGLTRRLKALAPDVVHCHNLLQAQTVRVALAKAMGRERVRLVVDDHMHTSVVRRSTIGRAFYAFHRAAVQPLLSREVDRFCAISEDTRVYLRDLCGVTAEIELRPLGVDVDAFGPSAPLRRQWRERLGLDANDLVLLYTGKVIEAKGVHVLVAAALELLRDGDRLKVVIVGDAEPDYLERIRQQIAAASRIEDFRFHPSVPHPELPGAYAAADIAIWPRQESMALLEAMSSALPVVVSDRSGYATLVEGGPGAVFAHDDETSLAGVLRGLFDPKRRATLGAAGRALTQRDYSWQRSAERYLETYGEAAPSVARRS
jgi:glycosyltransferase involved in cell wall biosynthesis